MSLRNLCSLAITIAALSIIATTSVEAQQAKGGNLGAGASQDDRGNRRDDPNIPRQKKSDPTPWCGPMMVPCGGGQNAKGQGGNTNPDAPHQHPVPDPDKKTPSKKKKAPSHPTPHQPSPHQPSPPEPTGNEGPTMKPGKGDDL